MRKLLALLLLAVVLVGGWWYASPWLAMRGLADAAATRDTEQLEQRIDFPALRENARSQLDDAVTPGEDDTLGALAGLIVENVGGIAIEAALTPQGVARLIESGALVAGLLPERLRNQQIDWAVERGGLDRFRAVGTFEDGTRGPVLVFDRHGLGWQVTGFELPAYR